MDGRGSPISGHLSGDDHAVTLIRRFFLNRFFCTFSEHVSVGAIPVERDRGNNWYFNLLRNSLRRIRHCVGYLLAAMHANGFCVRFRLKLRFLYELRAAKRDDVVSVTWQDRVVVTGPLPRSRLLERRQEHVIGCHLSEFTKRYELVVVRPNDRYSVFLAFAGEDRRTCPERGFPFRPVESEVDGNSIRQGKWCRVCVFRVWSSLALGCPSFELSAYGIDGGGTSARRQVPTFVCFGVC